MRAQACGIGCRAAAPPVPSSGCPRGQIKEAVTKWRENCINRVVAVLIMPHSGMKLEP
jgi:hypothetical protein